MALGAVDPQVVSLVDPIWQETAVPYGPLFLGLEAGVVEAAGHHETAAIEGLRILALAGVLLAAAALPRWLGAGAPPVTCRRPGGSQPPHPARIDLTWAQ